MNIAQEVLKALTALTVLKDMLPTYVTSGIELHNIDANGGDLFFNYEDCTVSTVYVYRDGQYHILWKSREYY